MWESECKFHEQYGTRLTLDIINPHPLEMKPNKVYICTIKEKRAGRSLDANAYCWKLCDLIAEAVDSSKDEIYEEMLQKYGYLGDATITVKASQDMAEIEGHWKFYQESSDGKFKAFLKIRGSSEYDSKEMARFIDRIIEEAKELDIETLPPDELERIKNTWKNTQ